MTNGEGYAQRHLQQSDYFDQNRTVQGQDESVTRVLPKLLVRLCRKYPRGRIPAELVDTNHTRRAVFAAVRRVRRGLRPPAQRRKRCCCSRWPDRCRRRTELSRVAAG